MGANKVAMGSGNLKAHAGNGEMKKTVDENTRIYDKKDKPGMIWLEVLWVMIDVQLPKDLFDPCFDSKRPYLGWFKPKKIGQTSSRYLQL